MASFFLWGVIASPYQLKMQSLLDFAGHSWQRWPEQGARWSAPAMALRLARAKRRGEVQRFPEMSRDLDEYPTVPFYSEDGRQFFYDSSSLALHLDARRDGHQDGNSLPLVPREPGQAFLCRLIDEAFDEFGLYMVHHMRWVGSARTTPMGQMTAREMRLLLPPGLAPVLARRLCRRQVSRCPYLFSVAPPGFDAGVSEERTPPSRDGFPPTHDILEQSWRTYLAGMEQLLSEQPYLLGERFTLADASAYGQLGMNLVDGAATRLLQELAPLTYRWLCAIRDGEHVGGRGELYLSPSLGTLLQIIEQTFVPLMVQNERAYVRALAAGETVFNEAAFDQGRALYDGELLGLPFRAAIKTFQVEVWRSLRESWQALDEGARSALEQGFLPRAREFFDGDAAPGS